MSEYSSETDQSGQPLSEIGYLDPERVAWLYDRVNNHSPEPVLAIERTEDGSMVVNVGEVSDLLGVLTTSAHELEVGRMQARRLLAYLQGQTSAQIAETEGVKVETIYTFKMKIGKYLAQRLVESPAQSDLHSVVPENAETPRCPRFLEPLAEQLSARQLLVLSTRYDDDGTALMSFESAARQLGVTKSQVQDTERWVWKRFPDHKPLRGSGKPVYRTEFSVGDSVWEITPRQAEVMSYLYDADGLQKMSAKEVAEKCSISVPSVKNIERQVLGAFSEGMMELSIAEGVWHVTPRQHEIMSYLYDADGRERMTAHEAARLLGIGRDTVEQTRRQVLDMFPVSKSSHAPVRTRQKATLPNQPKRHRIGEDVFDLTELQSKIIGLLYDSDGLERMTIVEAAEKAGISEGHVRYIRRAALGTMPPRSGGLETYINHHVAGMVLRLTPPQSEAMELLYDADGLQRMSSEEAAAKLGISTDAVDIRRRRSIGRIDEHKERGASLNEETLRMGTTPVQVRAAIQEMAYRELLSIRDASALQIYIENKNPFSLDRATIRGQFDALDHLQYRLKALQKRSESMPLTRGQFEIFQQLIGDRDMHVRPRPRLMLVSAFEQAVRQHLPQQTSEAVIQERVADYEAYVRGAFIAGLRWVTTPD